MFGRKTCKFCGKKTNKEFFFCPYCGNSFNHGEQRTLAQGNVQRNIQGSMGNYLDDDFDMNFGFAFNTIFRQLEKQLDKQLRALDKELARGGAQGVSIRVDTTRGTPEIMIKPISHSQDITGRREVRGNGIRSRASKEGTKGEILPQKLSERHLELLQKHINLPREEPKTSIRRLADRIIYEIVLPDVSSLDDIFIRRFQTSIEVKAFSKARNKVYFKVIPLNMEILHYALQDGKLFLELRE